MGLLPKKMGNFAEGKISLRIPRRTRNQSWRLESSIASLAISGANPRSPQSPLVGTTIWGEGARGEGGGGGGGWPPPGSKLAMA